jgi:hypothetical protein
MKFNSTTTALGFIFMAVLVFTACGEKKNEPQED